MFGIEGGEPVVAPNIVIVVRVGAFVGRWPRSAAIVKRLRISVANQISQSFAEALGKLYRQPVVVAPGKSHKLLDHTKLRVRSPAQDCPDRRWSRRVQRKQLLPVLAHRAEIANLEHCRTAQLSLYV